MPFVTFSDGQYRVGQDIHAGTYRLRAQPSSCYWEREKDFNGGVDSILANDNTASYAVVTILPSDAGFMSRGCGTWSADLSAVISGPTFSDGQYIVGTDVKPGRYRSSGNAGCYWEREKDFTGAGSNAIIANNNTDTPAIVTIAASDKGFKASNCGTWTRG
ncbi:MAG: hypothetical protein M3019_08210 [Candidatus Dormibacteraeota bacterium]|nr:hypothetical protein [Candidatus Dormibacteraeota bacterium]